MSDKARDDDLVMSLVDQALDRPAAEREVYVRNACDGDEELFGQVWGYVLAEERMTGFLVDPLCPVASTEHWFAPGELLEGRFRIVREVAQGAMGVVYEAADEKLERRIALKCAKAGFGNRLPPEVRYASTISHPNVCKIYEIHTASTARGAIDFLTMEYLEGETLAERLLRGPVSEPEARGLALQLCAGLAEAHRNHVIHGDLKSGNVILSRGADGGVRAVITDFGLAAQRDAGEEAGQPAQVGGTPDYMAPELWKGEKASVASDIYALGIILYELASGRRPPAAHESGSPSSREGQLVEKAPDVPPGWRRVLERCLNADPRRRYQRADEVAEALAPAPLQMERSQRGWRIAAVLGAAVAALGIGQLVFFRPHTSAPTPFRTVPFTTFEGGEYEPKFSPDGTQVAFVWEGEEPDHFNVYVKPVRGGTPRRLTTDSASEGSPAWSPDGRSIAFLRYGERPGVSGIFVTPVAGQADVKITDVFPRAHIFDRHLDWSSDGKFLTYVDKESATLPFRIYVYSFERKERRALTFPPNESFGDTGPSISPDRKSIVFRRSSSDGASDLYLAPAAGGTPQRLTFDNAVISGSDWMPDGRAIVLISRRSGSPGLWRLTMKDRSLSPIPGVAQGANFLSVSRQGNRLAYSAWFADTNVWRMRIGAGTNREKASALITSTLEDRSPQYSPDDQRIAFRSNRSGSDEIWVCDGDGRNAVQLTSFGGPLTGTPRWSPDGTRIAFDSRPDGRSHIYVIGATGGAVRRITNGSANDAVPSWSRDGKWIYFASNRGGQWQVWKTPSDGGNADGGSVPVTHEGGFAAFESADGKQVYYAKGPAVAGLWSVPGDGGKEAVVIPDLKAGCWGYWAVAPGGIYFLDPAPGGACAVKFHSFTSKQTRQIASLPKEPPYGDSGFALSGDGAWILYTQVDHSGSNIMLVEEFR